MYRFKSGLLTLVQEGNVNNKLYRNTAIYIVNPQILHATKKSLTSTPEILDCGTPVNINSEQIVSPSNAPTVSTRNAVNRNPQEYFFTDSAHPSPLSSTIAVNPKNTYFHADYLTLKDLLINEICVLRNEVISNRQYIDQVLADANISSQISKLIAKIELLEKENMELTRIVINKEIIIQKLSSNTNIRKEIPKNDKSDCPTNKGEEYSNPPEENIHRKKILRRLTKTKITSTNKITEIRHNQHKNYLQSKNSEKNTNQSSKEERQNVYQWPKETVAIIGDSMVMKSLKKSFKEELLSNKKHQLKVRCSRGAMVKDV